MLYTIWKAKKIRLSISVPSLNDLLMFVKLAGPILLTMLSKNFFYTLLTFVATSLGNAHNPYFLQCMSPSAKGLLGVCYWSA